MKKTITLLLLICCFMQNWAQEIDPNSITTWIGSGDKKAYLIIDFNDATANESLIWGFKYSDNSNYTIHSMLQELQASQECFSFEGSTTFLDYVFFHDKGDDSGTDWWKVWGGSSYANLSMNSGISSRIQENYVYALSYGFMCGDICNAQPSFPTPAPSCSSLSINKIQENKIVLSPNPVQDFVNIQLDLKINPTLISIFSIDGKKLSQFSFAENINLTNLPSGIYILNIHTKQGIITKKITKK